MADKKFDFSSATQVTDEKPAVSPLPNTAFGGKPDWPNATEAPSEHLKPSRQGTADSHFGTDRKLDADFSSATSIPLPDGNTTERVRPDARPQAWEK